MKKKAYLALVLYTLIIFIGCTKPFEFGSDKFYLESIMNGGQNSTWYYFCKKIDSDMIMEHISDTVVEGYDVQTTNIMGRIGFVSIEKQDEDPYLYVGFCCFYKSGMGSNKADIIFKYTVKSTMERKEEIWELDFSQKPYKDLREA